MITEVKQKVPVHANIYTSNAITISKRLNPMPAEVGFQYRSTERVNKFKPDHLNRKNLSDTFQTGERYYMIPHSRSPYAMESGVSDADKFKELVRTVEHLQFFVTRDSTKLPNQGPSPLPLVGKSNRPFQFGNVVRNSNDPLKLNDFRANQFKETLTAKFFDASPRRTSLACRPSPLDPTLAYKATIQQVNAAYTNAPVVKQALRLERDHYKTWGMGDKNPLVD